MNKTQIEPENIPFMLAYLKTHLPDWTFQAGANKQHIAAFPPFFGPETFNQLTQYAVISSNMGSAGWIVDMICV